MKKKQIIRKIFDIFLDILIIFIFLITCYLVYFNLKSEKSNYVTVFGIHFDVCETNSMEPFINVGDLIISSKVSNNSNLEVGDVITYDNSNSYRSMTITHRIIRIDEDKYITQGDNKEVSIIEDSGVTKDKILGKYLFKIPKIGKAIDFLKTKVGFFFCVLVPIILLMFIKIFQFIVTKPKNNTCNESNFSQKE